MGKSTITINITENGTFIKSHGNTYDILKGLAAAADIIINSYPEDLQQPGRIKFIQMLNDAKAGNLYKDKED